MTEEPRIQTGDAEVTQFSNSRKLLPTLGWRDREEAVTRIRVTQHKMGAQWSWQVGAGDTVTTRDTA